MILSEKCQSIRIGRIGLELVQPVAKQKLSSVGICSQTEQCAHIVCFFIAFNTFSLRRILKTVLEHLHSLPTSRLLLQQSAQQIQIIILVNIAMYVHYYRSTIRQAFVCSDMVLIRTKVILRKKYIQYRGSCWFFVQISSNNYAYSVGNGMDEESFNLESSNLNLFRFQDKLL